VSDSEPEKKKDSAAGMIGRRVLMPLAMWAEITSLSRTSGGDTRDVLLQLLDLGLQAQDVGRFKPRFVTVEGPVQDRLADYTAAAGISEDKAIVQLLDLGLQVKSAKGVIPARVEGALIRFELDGALLLETRGYHVPTAGEVVTVLGTPYVVAQRASSANHSGLVTYLRLSHYA